MEIMIKGTRTQPDAHLVRHVIEVTAEKEHGKRYDIRVIFIVQVMDYRGLLSNAQYRRGYTYIAAYDESIYIPISRSSMGLTSMQMIAVALVGRLPDFTARTFTETYNRALVSLTTPELVAEMFPDGYIGGYMMPEEIRTELRRLVDGEDRHTSLSRSDTSIPQSLPSPSS